MHRAELGRELTGAIVEDLRTDNVVRHEVGRALDSTERSADRARERLRGGRLRETGHRLEQHVATGGEACEKREPQTFLTDDARAEHLGDTRDNMRRPFPLSGAEHGTFRLERPRTGGPLPYRTRRRRLTIHTHARTSFAASRSITRARARAPRHDNTEPDSTPRQKHGKRQMSETMCA